MIRTLPKGAHLILKRHNKSNLMEDTNWLESIVDYPGYIHYYNPLIHDGPYQTSGYLQTDFCPHTPGSTYTITIACGNTGGVEDVYLPRDIPKQPFLKRIQTKIKDIGRTIFLYTKGFIGCVILSFVLLFALLPKHLREDHLYAFWLYTFLVVYLTATILNFIRDLRKDSWKYRD